MAKVMTEICIGLLGDIDLKLKQNEIHSTVIITSFSFVTYDNTVVCILFFNSNDNRPTVRTHTTADHPVSCGIQIMSYFISSCCSSGYTYTSLLVNDRTICIKSAGTGNFKSLFQTCQFGMS